jgi:hypothetical protein
MSGPSDSGVQLVKIFVSSPADVWRERQLLEDIVRRVNETQATTDGFLFELVRWEQHVVPRVGPEAQKVVDEQTPSYDVYLGIMSQRFGTPTGEHGSGTEAEFRDALRSWRQHGSPWILFYFDDEAGTDRGQQESAGQFEQVQRFRQELEARGLVASYRGLRGEGGFFERVDRHLRLLIRELKKRESPPSRDEFESLIRSHLDSYLSPSAGSVFVGRENEIDRVGGWLEQTDRRRLLITGRAGIGKSAFLANVQSRLRRIENSDVVFFPVSVRFGTNLASVFFPSLLAQLAAVRKEPQQATPSGIERWRAQLADHLSKPHVPPGRRLVVIIDGLDEATGWSADSSLWPVVLGERVHLIVSARMLAGDSEAASWLTRIGWHRTRDADVLSLTPLNHAAVATAVSQIRSSSPAPDDLVRELWRLTSGDPLTLGAYLTELETHRDVNATQLGSLEPGMHGLMRRWWQEQRLVWGGEDPLREERIRTVLGILACALGPLSRDDLIAAAGPTEELTAWHVRDAVEAFARLVGGDDDRGYAYTHPEFRDFFVSQFDKRSLRGYVQRFRQWHEETLAGLTSGQLRASDVPVYQLRYLSAHLRQDEVALPVAASLVSREWIAASRAFDGSWSEFSKDCDYVRETAAAALASESGGCPNASLALTTHFRAIVCQTSVGSLSLAVPASLLRALVEHKQWSVGQALSLARRHFFPSDRLSSLVALLDFVDPSARDELLDEIFALIGAAEEWVGLDELLPPLAVALQSDKELARFTAATERIPQLKTRANAFRAIASACQVPFDWWPATRPLVEEALSLCHYDEYAGKTILVAVAPLVPQQHRCEVLERLAALPRCRKDVLIAFVPTDDSERIRAVLPTLSEEERWDSARHVPWHKVPDLAEKAGLDARSDHNLGRKLHILQQVLPHLTDSSKQELTAIAFETALALPESLGTSDSFASLGRVLAPTRPDAIRLLMETRPRFAYEILTAAADLLPPRAVQNLVARLERPEQRTLVLIRWVLPHVHGSERTEIVHEAFAAATDDPLYPSSLLWSELAPLLTVDQLNLFRERTKDFRPGPRLESLLILSERLPPGARDSWLEETLRIVASLPGREWHYKQRLLNTVVPHLPPKMLQTAVLSSEAIRDFDSQVAFLISVGRRLEGVQQRAVLESASHLLEQVEDDDEWAELSAKLIPVLPLSLRRAAASVVARQIVGNLREKQLRLFTVALRALAPSNRPTLIKAAWAVVTSAEDPQAQSRGAATLLPHVRNRKQAATLALAKAATLPDPNTRVPIMREAFRALPSNLVGLAVTAARAEPVDWAKGSLFAEIGARAPDEVRREAEEALKVGNNFGACLMLAAISRCYKGAARTLICEQLVDALQQLQGFDLAAVLEEVGPLLDQAVASHAFASASALWNPVARAEAQSALISHLPEPSRAAAIPGILELLDSATSWQRTAVVGKLARHASAESAADCLHFFIEAKWVPFPDVLGVLAERASTLEATCCSDLWHKLCEMVPAHDAAGRRWALPRFAALLPLLHTAGGTSALVSATEQLANICDIWP